MDIRVYANELLRLKGIDYKKVEFMILCEYDEKSTWERGEDKKIIPIFVPTYVEFKNDFSEDMDKMPWHNRILREAARVYCGQSKKNARDCFMEIMCFFVQIIIFVRILKRKTPIDEADINVDSIYSIIKKRFGIRLQKYIEYIVIRAETQT
jgi:hypothetical protein